MKNEDARRRIEQIVDVEKRVARAVRLHGDKSWRFAPWAKPLSPPYAWNDILVVKPDGKVRLVAAVDYYQERQ